MEILLNKNKSVSSMNVENVISIGLEGKSKLLPNENVVDEFSRYEQYLKERDDSNKFRIILNINDVCSNVLFNGVSEVLVKEGSDECDCLNFSLNGWNKDEYAVSAINSTQQITYEHAIRDTEYSNEANGNFEYHCGLDIFNNHMLRNKTFIHVNKVSENDETPDKYDHYHTISDYLRGADGKIVEEDIQVSYKPNNDNTYTKTKRHLYNTDSLYTIKEAFSYNAIEKDGWWGFINPGMINVQTSENKDIAVNEMLSNKKPCEFIDLYPDRSLFSFIPKQNKHRMRAERNWDYCLTYPSSKDVDLLNKICGNDNGAIRVRFKIVTDSNGVRLLQCSSYFKHNLNPNSYVNFYYYKNISGYTECDNINENMIPPISDITVETEDEIEETQHDSEEMPDQTDDVQEQTIVRDGEVENDDENEDDEENALLKLFKLNSKISVYSVGDLNGENTDRVFSVKYDDIKSVEYFFKCHGCFYKKVSNGVECSYYVRKFKKILNDDGKEIASDITKTAYSTNIYGDKIAQIVFTDTVDVSRLQDENGRELTDIFLTIVKRNKGNKLWYANRSFGSDEVEYSHCFGKVTSGIDFSGIDINEEPFDYNVHYLHNLNIDDTEMAIIERTDRQARNTLSAWGETVLTGVPKVVEDNITIDEDEFYGDVVEFDNFNYRTTVIGDICHRFNTVQRENFIREFRDIFTDVITHDDYETSNFDHTIFTVDTYYVNDAISPLNSKNDLLNIDNVVYGNIFPEGYFYKPHLDLKLRQEGDLMQSDCKYINYDKFEITGQNVVQTYIESNDEAVVVYKKYKYDMEETIPSETVLRDVTVGTELTIDGYFLKIVVPVDYGFVNDDFVAAYDKVSKEICWGTIKSFVDNVMVLYFDRTCFNGLNISSNPSYFAPNNANRRFFLFWSKNAIPFYAKFCPEINEFTWRKVLKPSEIGNDNQMYDLPYSNGCHYLHKNLNFYLKRQDPMGDYGLSSPLYKEYQMSMPNPMTGFVIKGNTKIDFSKLFGNWNNDFNICY